MRKNKIEGAIKGSGRPSKNRKYKTYYLDKELSERLDKIKNFSNDLLNEVLKSIFER